MAKDTKILRSLVLMFPVLALIGMAGHAAIGQHYGGQVWRIPIGGYDPRDLLYGHYLTFRYVWNREDGAPVPDQEQAVWLCLNPSEENSISNPRARLYSKKEKESASCVSHLKVWPRWNALSLRRNASFGTDRYFIPEKNAHIVESMLWSDDHTFEMEIIVRKNGKAAVRGLFVDGERLEDYLRKMPGTGS